MRMAFPHLWAEMEVGAGESGQEVAASGRLGQQLGTGGGEQLATERELGLAVAVGQEAVVADALQAGRRHVLEEAADELHGGDGHHSGFAGIAVIFPLEGYLTVFESQQTAVGDGHPMGVAAEILQDVARSAKGGLGVDYPFLVLEGFQVAGQGGWVGERCEVTEELEFSLGMSFGESLQKEVAEACAEDLDGQQEFTAARDPAVMVRGQAATGNDAVQVGMEVQVLPPTMEHGEEPGFHPQALGVAGNGEQGLGDSAEEHVVDDLLVIEGDGGDLFGQSEDHVEVFGGQQLGGPLLDPLGAGGALAFGAVAVPTGAKPDVHVLALVAPFDHTTQQRRTAGFDGLHDAAVMQR